MFITTFFLEWETSGNKRKDPSHSLKLDSSVKAGPSVSAWKTVFDMLLNGNVLICIHLFIRKVKTASKISQVQSSQIRPLL